MVNKIEISRYAEMLIDHIDTGMNIHKGGRPAPWKNTDFVFAPNQALFSEINRSVPTCSCHDNKIGTVIKTIVKLYCCRLMAIDRA